MRAYTIKLKGRLQWHRVVLSEIGIKYPNKPEIILNTNHLFIRKKDAQTYLDTFKEEERKYYEVVGLTFDKQLK